MKNDSRLYKALLAQFVLEDDPLLAMLKWIMNEMIKLRTLMATSSFLKTRACYKLLIPKSINYFHILSDNARINSEFDSDLDILEISAKNLV